MYYSINNTSSTVGHGPAAISLLEGSSEPAVNSVAPLSLTPGSRSAKCHAPSFEGGCRAQQPTDCTRLGGAHGHRALESHGAGGGGSQCVESSATLPPCCFERLNVFKRRLHRAWSPRDVVCAVSGQRGPRHVRCGEYTKKTKELLRAHLGGGPSPGRIPGAPAARSRRN